MDTKRPFTPRQTDRRLYSGSTNHVARPPSSFRLLPLPEEEPGRPGTGVRLSPLSAQSSIKSEKDVFLNSNVSFDSLPSWVAFPDFDR